MLSKLRRNFGRMAATLLLVCVVAIEPVGSQQAMPVCHNGPSAMVPAFVAAAAARTPTDFASALASARVCAGFIVSRKAAGETTRAWRLQPVEPKVPLAEAVAAFESSHPDLIVENLDAILLVRDRRRDLALAPLASPAKPFQVSNLRAIDAFRKLVATFDPLHAPQIGGSIGSNISRPDERPPTDEDLQGPMIAIPPADVSLLNALVQVARRAPGVVWMVRFPLSGESATQQSNHELICYLARGKVTIGEMTLR